MDTEDLDRNDNYQQTDRQTRQWVLCNTHSHNIKREKNRKATAKWPLGDHQFLSALEHHSRTTTTSLRLHYVIVRMRLIVLIYYTATSVTPPPPSTTKNMKWNSHYSPSPLFVRLPAWHSHPFISRHLGGSLQRAGQQLVRSEYMAILISASCQHPCAPERRPVSQPSRVLALDKRRSALDGQSGPCAGLFCDFCVAHREGKAEVEGWAGVSFLSAYSPRESWQVNWKQWMGKLAEKE